MPIYKLLYTFFFSYGGLAFHTIINAVEGIMTVPKQQTGRESTNMIMTQSPMPRNQFQWQEQYAPRVCKHIETKYTILGTRVRVYMHMYTK